MAKQGKRMDYPGNPAPVVLYLLISGRKVKDADVDFTGSDTLEARKSLVKDYYGTILKSTCDQFIEDGDDWQLVLVCQSKMNQPGQ